MTWSVDCCLFYLQTQLTEGRVFYLQGHCLYRYPPSTKKIGTGVFRQGAQNTNMKKPKDDSIKYIHCGVQNQYIDIPYYCYHARFASNRCYDRLTPLEELE